MKIEPGDVFLLDTAIVYQRHYHAVLGDGRHGYVPDTVYVIDVFNEELNGLHPGHRVTAVNLSLGEECKITIFPAASAAVWNVHLGRIDGKCFSGDHRLSTGRSFAGRGRSGIAP